MKAADKGVMKNMVHIKGKAGAPGIAQGTIIFWRKTPTQTADGPADPSAERARLERARRDCQERTECLYRDVLKKYGEDEAKIVKTYRMLLEDDMFFSPIYKEISEGKKACAALDAQVGKLASRFAMMETEYMRERADDIRHVGSMLADSLNGTDAFSLPEEPSILVAEDLSPVDTLTLDRKYLAGIATRRGGKTSHTVILAKNLGIPAVTGVERAFEIIEENSTGILDGSEGDLYAAPDETTTSRYQTLIRQENLFANRIREARYQKGVTRDMVPIQICGNIGGASDMDAFEALEYDGIGLFRTEFLYSRFSRYPTFEEQREAYAEVVRKAAGRPVIIRTLDVGGDKALPYFGLPKEENPFLGFRAVRVCLRREEVFLDQLMAILAAGAEGKVKIMFPMICEMRELTDCRRILEKAKATLKERNISFDPEVPVGIMVETPAAAIMADRFAAACDFFSIGTNDLTQYVTCADRTNPEVQELYNPYNPAVIRLICSIIRAAKRAGIEAGVCGELAGDLKYVPLLIGLGVSKLSVAPGLIEKVRYLVCNAEQRKLAIQMDEILNMSNAREIEERLSKISKEILDF